MSAGRPAALLFETERLAERFLLAATPPEKPPQAEGGWSFVTKGKFRVDPTELAEDMHAYLLAERGIQAFFLAYSLQWFRHQRKVKRVPTDPEFLTYRELVRTRAVSLVKECDQRMSRVMDKMADGEVVFPVGEPEVRAADLVALADQRRMEAEQGSTGHLIQGFLEQVAPDERKDVARALLTLILEYWRERAAATMAFFDKLKG